MAWSDGRRANPRQDTAVTGDIEVTANFALDACVPHQADQDGDWGIELSPEMTRLIQFYNSDGYHCEAGTEDGYAPGAAAGKGLSGGGTLTAVRVLRAVTGHRDGTYEVVVTLTHSAPAALTALALVEALPAGWSFERLVSRGAAPQVRPAAGARGTLEFAWVALPKAWPVTFAYRVGVPLRSPVSKAFAGEAYFREGGGERQVCIRFERGAGFAEPVVAAAAGAVLAESGELTGTHAASVAGQPLTVDLVQDDGGRLSGVAVWQVAGAPGTAPVALSLAVQGRVRGVAGTPVVTLSMRGNAASVGVFAALQWRLERPAGAGPLAGLVRGWTETPAAVVQVAEPALLEPLSP